MANCPKCRGQMTPGFTLLPDTGGRVKWLDGEPSAWRAAAASLGIGRKATDLTAHRCSLCGFVEFFADPTAKPIKSLATVEGETEQLRGLVAKLQDRLAVLETIATDPAERTAREIERLRDPPSPDRDPAAS